MRSNDFDIFVDIVAKSNRQNFSKLFKKTKRKIVGQYFCIFFVDIGNIIKLSAITVEYPHCVQKAHVYCVVNAFVGKIKYTARLCRGDDINYIDAFVFYFFRSCRRSVSYRNYIFIAFIDNHTNGKIIVYTAVKKFFIGIFVVFK